MAAGAATLAAFAANGLFAGLSGLFLATTLHRPSHALAGATLFVVFSAGVVSQLATAGLRASRVFALGTISMLVGLVLLVTAVRLSTPSLALFLISGALIGAGAGAVFKGTTGLVLDGTAPENRVAMTSELLIALFVGLSVPVVGAGSRARPRCKRAEHGARLRHLRRAGSRRGRMGAARAQAEELAAGRMTMDFRDSSAGLRRRRSRPGHTPPSTRRRCRHERTRNDHRHIRAARLRAGPAVGARPRAQRAGLLRRPRRAEPLLDHRRHLPVGVPDHLGRRRAARRAAHDRQQHPARGRRDRRRQRRQQQGHATSSTRTTTPTTPARPRCSTRTSPASGTRRPGACCCATTTRPGRRTRRRSRTAARWRSAASGSTWPGTAPTTRPTTSSSTCPTTTR